VKLSDVSDFPAWALYGHAYCVVQFCFFSLAYTFWVILLLEAGYYAITLSMGWRCTFGYMYYSASFLSFLFCVLTVPLYILLPMLQCACLRLQFKNGTWNMGTLLGCFGSDPGWALPATYLYLSLPATSAFSCLKFGCRLALSLYWRLTTWAGGSG
jgi:hypothetical protein